MTVLLQQSELFKKSVSFHTGVPVKHMQICVASCHCLAQLSLAIQSESFLQMAKAFNRHGQACTVLWAGQDRAG